MDYYKVIIVSFMKAHNNIETLFSSFGHATWLVKSQFPNQRFNLDHSSESTES